MIQLEREQRVGQLAEIHLEQRADGVHVIHVRLLLDLAEFLLVEGVAQPLYVGLEARVSVDAVHNAVLLNKLGADAQYLGHLLLAVAQMFAEIAGKHALLQYALRLQLIPGRTCVEKRPQYSHQFAVFNADCSSLNAN